MTSDTETRIMDAMCLIECVYFGECETLYKKWDHGIYEFRDRVSILAEFAHECWKIVTGDDHLHCDFDAEFCPAWLAKWMRLGIDSPEFITIATGRRFAREIKADILQAEADRQPSPISKSDRNFLIELAEIRRDQWLKGKAGNAVDSVDEIHESSATECGNMVTIIDSLLSRVTRDRS